MGETGEYFDVSQLSQLVQVASLEEFAAVRQQVTAVRRGQPLPSHCGIALSTLARPRFAVAQGGSGSCGDGVALCRIKLQYNPTWSDRGFELYPKVKLPNQPRPPSATD